MDISKAKEIANITNQINKCESYLKLLNGHTYKDEYDIYYRDMKTCNLEPEVLRIIVKNYTDKLEELQNKLIKM